MAIWKPLDPNEGIFRFRRLLVDRSGFLLTLHIHIWPLAASQNKNLQAISKVTTIFEVARASAIMHSPESLQFYARLSIRLRSSNHRVWSPILQGDRLASLK